MSGFVRWVRNHDESWLFVAVYIGFAVVLSVMLSLFWLVAMVAIHFAFEVIRQSREYDRWPKVLSMASWEVRLDVALVLLAFAVSLYMDAVMGIVGLQSAGRAAMATQAASRVGTRAVAWQRAVRAVVLGFDDVANAIRAVFMRKKGGEPAAVEAVPSEPAAAEVARPAPAGSARVPGWGQKWSGWDHLTMALGAGCVAAMIAAPGFTGSTYGEAAQSLREELHPFPAAAVRAETPDAEAGVPASEAEVPASEAEVPAPEAEMPAAVRVDEGET
jgi:hypothetical protein